MRMLANSDIRKKNAKKILLISYLFPPVGGPRSIRWAYFTDYLSTKGYHIDVLTISPSRNYPRFGEENKRLISSSICVYRTYPGLGYRVAFGSRTRGRSTDRAEAKGSKLGLIDLIKNIYRILGVRYALLPDEMMEWLPWAIRAGYKLVRDRNYDLIISNDFPNHIVGFFLKKKTGIPWVTDYGDPWAFGPAADFPPWRKILRKRLETFLLKTVDKIIVTTEETKKGYLELYPFLDSKRIDVISQGYDPKKFEDVSAQTSNRFRIVYTGRFYDKIREPYTFFEAIREFKEENIEVIIAGEIFPQYCKYIAENNLSQKITLLGYQSYLNSIALQKEATVLLFLGNNSPYQLPGKIFEYLAARRPILGISSYEKDIGTKFIREHNRGLIVEDNSAAIASVIHHLYGLWEKGMLDESFNLNEIKEYSWDCSGEKLEKLISSYF